MVMMIILIIMIMINMMFRFSDRSARIPGTC